jgi:hypothetical protein
MRRDRGTIRDDELDDFLLPAIKRISAVYRRRGKINEPGMVIPPDQLKLKLKTAFRMNRVNHDHLKSKMEALGFKWMAGTKGKNMWFYEGVGTEEELHKALGIDGEEYDGPEGDDLDEDAAAFR